MSLSLYIRPNAPEQALVFEHEYGPNTPDLVFRDAQLIYEGDDSEIYRGKLFRPTEWELEGLDVVCKVAYHRTAVSCIEHEAGMYTNELRHLQGICIPICYGYFANRDRVKWSSCLVLQYSGEPIKKAFADLDSTFKKALVHAATLMHDAGFKHNNWVEENVLDNDGFPMIIDLEDVEPHTCQRAHEVIEGALSPRIQDFKCNELFQLCQDLKIWKPGMIKCSHGYVPIKRGLNAEALAATLPDSIPRDVALKRAKRAIKLHMKRVYPEKYAEWKRKKHQSRSGSSAKSSSSGSSTAAATSQ